MFVRVTVKHVKLVFLDFMEHLFAINVQKIAINVLNLIFVMKMDVILLIFIIKQLNFADKVVLNIVQVDAIMKNKELVIHVMLDMVIKAQQINHVDNVVQIVILQIIVILITLINAIRVKVVLF